MSSRRRIVLELTPGEAAALGRLVDEGREGLLTDKAAAAGYLGGPANIAAARRAIEKVYAAVATAQRMTNPKGKQ